MMGWTLLQSSVQSSAFAIITGILAICSLVLWWIVRRRVRDFWLPIVRVFDFPMSRLPRLILRQPPWIPFLMFAVAAICLDIWSFRPSVRVFSDFEPEMSQIHVFVDLSPSVSSQVTLSDLTGRLVSVLEKIGPKSRVTMGTSHGSEIYEVATPSAAVDLITGLGFHRGGVKIGSAVRSQVARIGEIDQLFIVSDRDQHSWGGFQWQYLLVDADIRHVDVDSSNQRSARSNVYIQEASYLSAPGSLTMDWDVVISEGALTMPASGSLSARFDGDVLATGRWEILPGQRSTTVNVSWPATKVPTGLNDQNPDQNQHRHLEWTIEVDNGDAMLMDNKFVTPLSGRRDKVAIVAEPFGEMKLDDPMTPLTAALEVSGYNVARFDRWPKTNSKSGLEVLGQPKLIIAQAGDPTSVDAWCPDITENTGTNIKATSWEGAVWLVPRDLQSSFDGLCRCLLKLVSSSTNLTCPANISRDSLMAELMDQGGAQLGGDVGQAKGALAIRLPKSAASIDLIIFTIPLRPDARLGISWGTFPLLVRDLSQFLFGTAASQGRSDDMGARSWPRVSDVTQLSQIQGMVDVTYIARQTNVPVGESMLGVTPSNELPPLFATLGPGGRDRAPNKRDSEDPWPWILVLAVIMVSSMIIEVLWRFYSGRSRRNAASVMIILTATVWGEILVDHAQAEVKIEWLTDRPTTKINFKNLAREVASRTSIELSSDPLVFSVLDQTAAAKPWIWSPSVGKLATKDGVLRHDAVLWLKRGGLLILDGDYADQQIERLMSAVKSSAEPSWTNVPPDHEFMRSFYLLSALPACRGRTWKIFTFDGRVAAMAVPYSFLGQLQDSPVRWSCEGPVNYEQQVRVFVNLLMMALTTDYKRDQIHLPEILKRLRVP
jgi:hypothetical protein